jgi:hypothetical protein
MSNAQVAGLSVLPVTMVMLVLDMGTKLKSFEAFHHSALNA